MVGRRFSSDFQNNTYILIFVKVSLIADNFSSNTVLKTKKIHNVKQPFLIQVSLCRSKV